MYEACLTVMRMGRNDTENWHMLLRRTEGIVKVLLRSMTGPAKAPRASRARAWMICSWGEALDERSSNLGTLRAGRM